MIPATIIVVICGYFLVEALFDFWCEKNEKIRSETKHDAKEWVVFPTFVDILFAIHYFWVMFIYNKYFACTMPQGWVPCNTNNPKGKPHTI
jgi:hypothetical protein